MKKIILYCGLTGINITLKDGDDSKILETVKYTEYDVAVKLKKKYEKQFGIEAGQ